MPQLSSHFGLIHNQSKKKPSLACEASTASLCRHKSKARVEQKIRLSTRIPQNNMKTTLNYQTPPQFLMSHLVSHSTWSWDGHGA